MKITLQSISLLFVGLLLLSSCSEGKTGESMKQMADKLDLNQDEETGGVTSDDSIELETIEPVPPPPPIPPPLPPDQWPEPEPEPWPIPEPIPGPLPEPPPPPPVLNPIIDFPEVEPQYVGGEVEMRRFVAKNQKYPIIDLEQGNQGRVYVQFVVEKDGSLSNIKILRGISETMDKEVLRVMHLMPNWTPGEANGKKIRSRMRLPFSFWIQ